MIILVSHDYNIIPTLNHKMLQIVIFSSYTPIPTAGGKKCANLHKLGTYEVRGIPIFLVTFFLDQILLRNLHEVRIMNAHM